MVDDIVIYVADFCPYCDRAKRLLDAKGVNYKTIDITEDDNIREEMIEKSTVDSNFTSGFWLLSVVVK